ncbi:MAG: hypothetical protein ABIT38_21155, partial [Gemmatimonadaceae bacterium]
MAGRGQAGWRSSRWRMGNAAPAQALPPLLTAGAPPTEQPQAPPRGRRSIRATATAVFAPVARAGGAIIEDVLPWPWQGVRFSPAYVAFLTYVFVVTSYVVPLAQAAMVCAIGILTFGSKDRWKVPGPMAMLLAFFMFAALGYKMTRYAVYTWDPLMDLAKVVIV